MSQVLIDRAVLEATLEHAEFVSGAACEADDAIRAVLAAPISTPELPIKAYYYEAPNEYGGLNKSVGLEVRNTFIDAPLVLQSDAQAIIDGLRGEVERLDRESQNLSDQLGACGRDKNMFRAERDQHAQRIGELEGLLRHAQKQVPKGSGLHMRIDAALRTPGGKL